MAMFVVLSSLCLVMLTCQTVCGLNQEEEIRKLSSTVDSLKVKIEKLQQNMTDTSKQWAQNDKTLRGLVAVAHDVAEKASLKASEGLTLAGKANSQSCKLMNFGPFGGHSGYSFTDYDSYSKNGRITKIELCSDKSDQDARPDSITMTYGNVGGVKHGKGGSCTQHVLRADEAITGIKGAWKKLVTGIIILNMIEIQTNKRTFASFGTTTDNKFSLHADGRPLAYIGGKSGYSIDQLIFYFECQK